MTSDNPVVESESFNRLRLHIEKLAPWLWPTVMITFLILIVVSVLFIIMAIRHLTLGFAELNLMNSGNVGQFIGGTIGTLLGAITSILLVITLWVQINEYRLTRHELQQTVNAQQEMARAHAEQLGPLREQAMVSRQVMEMDLLTRAILDLREDMQGFRRDDMHSTKGIRPVMVELCIALDPGTTFQEKLADKAPSAHLINVIGTVSRTLLAFTLLIERAELIYLDLTNRDLPSTARSIRRKELVLLVNMECRDLAHSLDHLQARLTQIPDGIGHIVDQFKARNSKRLEKCISQLLMFMRIPLDEDL